MRIGVVASGGDCPGMNAYCVELSKIFNKRSNYELIGFNGGYRGIEENEGSLLRYNISDLPLSKNGGCFLKVGRYPELKNKDRIVEFVKKIKNIYLDVLIVLGGDGSLIGALKLSRMGIKVIGVPCTIDNNIKGTEYTLGFDTAINKTLLNINDIEDTASAMPGKIYMIETLGGDCGNIAKAAVEEGAADFALIPEKKLDDEEIINISKELFKRGNKYQIITVCEGLNKTFHYCELLRKALNRKVHLTIIGHQQRGGSPTAFDRFIARQFAIKTYELIILSVDGVMLSYSEGKVGYCKFTEAN